MRLLLAALCSATLMSMGAAQHPDADAADCVVFDESSDADSSDNLHVKEFERRVSMGVLPQTNMMAGKLLLTSSDTRHNCNIQFLAEVIVASCTDGDSVIRNSGTHKWPFIFSQGDMTELWLQVGDDEVEDDPLITPSTDLLLVGRRGKHRGHLLFPSSGLQPPVRLRWKALQNMKYYFNCITGCLFTRAGKTQPGEHSVFLRQDKSFHQLTLTYMSSVRGQHVVNVTSDDLGPARDLNNVTLVWNDHAGTVGVLVDGAPVANLSKYSALNEAGEVEAEVTEGLGFVSTCDLRYQKVAGPPCAGGDGGRPYDDLNATSSLTVADDSDSSLDAPGSSDAIQVISALLAVTLVCLATTIVFALLYYHTNKKLQCLQKATGTTSSTTTTRNSSVRSSHRRKEPVPLQDNEDSTSLSEATLALSETVMTPAPTPGSLSETRSPKFVSTKDFIDLDLN